MNDQRHEHDMDKLFRTKLKQLDLGPQAHLWEKIELEIERNKKYSRILGFGWYSRLFVVFTVLSFGVILAYKLGLNTEEKTKSNFLKVESQPSLLPVADPISIGTEAPQQDQLNAGDVALTSKSSSQVFDSQANRSIVMNLLNEKKQNISETRQTNRRNTPNTINSNKLLLNNSNYINLKHEEEDKSIPEDSNLRSFSEVTPIVNNEIEEVLSGSKVSKNKKREIRDDCFSRNISPLSQIALDVYYSPEMSMRTIVSKDETNILYAQKRAGSEAYNGASSFGLRASYVTSSGLALRAGINFSKIKEKFDYFKGTEKKQVIIFDQNRNPIDTIYSDVEIIEQKYNTYKFLDLPIIVGYEIDLTDFVFSFNGGVGINLSSSYSGQVTGPDLMKLIDINNTNKDNAGGPYFKRNVGLSLIGSFGLDYKINGRLMLLAEPTIRYYLNPITADNYPLEQKYLQFGISMGLRYRFY